jgi:galactose mutarotase-like enzyme
MYEDLGETKTLQSGQRWEKKFSYAPSERFNWKWNAKLQVTLEQHTLTYSLTIKRDEDCESEEDMPYSLGFHPYFNTFGSDFSYKIAGHATHKQEVPQDITNSAFAPLIPSESATLTTRKGTLIIIPEGYDQYCLWTDNINSYFCIEPIFQYREYGLRGTLLKKGQSHETSVTLLFKTSEL